ncbi:MAG: ribonuclease HII [Thermoplasmatota archaeon]
MVGGALAGADEAGRGPVLGPLVVGAVACASDEPLRALGVRDSKQLSPARREALDAEIRRVARVALRVVPAEELNARMPRENLNEIEVAAFGDALRALAPPGSEGVRVAWVDACDVDAARFGARVARLAGCAVVSQHKADANHALVAAASIVAKVERDRLIAALAREVGADIGSGYPHDARTIAFLGSWFAERRTLPPFARREWKTCARLVAPRSAVRGGEDAPRGARRVTARRTRLSEFA